MRTFLFLVFSVFASVITEAQHVYQLTSDSLKITNHASSAELILENSTRNVNGFLYNKGGGRTVFQKALVKVNDSLYLIGGDTLKLASSTNASGMPLPGSPYYIQNQYGTAQPASAWISGRFKVAGLLSADSALSLKNNATDYTSATNGWLYYNSATNKLRVYQNGLWQSITTDGSGAFIQNQSIPQVANFNVSGNGIVGSTLSTTNFATNNGGAPNELSFSFTRTGYTTGVTIGRNVYSTGPIFVVRHSLQYAADAADNTAMAVFDVNGKNVAIMGSNQVYNKTAVRINASGMINANCGNGPYYMTGAYITAYNNLQSSFCQNYQANTYAIALRLAAVNHDSGYWKSKGVAIQADSGVVVIKDVFNAPANPDKFVVIHNDTLKYLTTAQLQTSLGGGGTGGSAAAYGNASQSGDGSTLTFTIPHLLAGVSSASKVFVTSRSADASGIKWINVDATSITIYYASPPPAGTGNLKWDWEVKP